MNKLKEFQELERRRKIAPWISKSTWKALDQLAKIPPFNQSNMKNPHKNLIKHIENNSKQWKTYVHSKKFIDNRMEVHS